MLILRMSPAALPMRPPEAAGQDVRFLAAGYGGGTVRRATIEGEAAAGRAFTLRPDPLWGERDDTAHDTVDEAEPAAGD
jgi:hypothetical protein